jgi:hypothetical protein
MPRWLRKVLQSLPELERSNPGSDRPLAAATATPPAPLPVEPEQLLVVDQVALTLEQNMQTPVADATISQNRQ